MILPPVKRAAGVLLVAAALGMLGYRQAHLDLAPFARDEPQFLGAAREQLRTGRWLSGNPLYGNMGLRYGPTAFWFYGVVQLLLGDDPRVAIAAMGLLVTLAHLVFALLLTRLFDEGAVFFAVVLAFVASSPYEFYWSRLAWDLTSNAGVFCAVALLCACRELRPGPSLALGLVLGLTLSTHLMVTPLLAAVGLALVWELQPQRLAAVGGRLAAAVAAVNLPYLLFLLRTPVVRRAPRQAISLAALGPSLLESPRVASTWGLEYYFERDWPDFQAWLGLASGPTGILSVLAVVVCAVGGAAGVAAAIVSSDERQRRVARVALLAWVGTVLLLAAVGLERHPHYQFPCAWVSVFGVAAGLAWLRRRSPRAGAAALIALGAIALAQFLVIVEWMGYIRERGGTRGGPYATPIGMQMATMRAVCAAPERLIVLQNDTAMYPFAFQYLATTEAACHGKSVVVCAAAPKPLTQPCPPPVPAARLRRLSYANERGGALRVD